MLYVLRVSLPDVPGTLGTAASALSQVGANIVSLRVIDRDDRHAFDEICVEALEVLPDEIRAAVEKAPGVVVETIRRTARIPDPLAALQLADRLARGEGPPFDVLIDGLPDALSASWTLALDSAAGAGLRVLSASPDAPSPGILEAPWLPLVGARRIEVTDRMPPGWRLHRYELAAAPLDDPARSILVGRPTGMRFTTSELRQLELLADMAVRADHRARASLGV